MSADTGKAAVAALREAAYRSVKHRRITIAQAQDQWVRERAEEAAAAHPAGSRLRRLYQDLGDWAEVMQERMRKTDEEMLDQAGLG
jgi:hypothetical protein